VARLTFPEDALLLRLAQVRDLPVGVHVRLIVAC